MWKFIISYPECCEAKETWSSQCQSWVRTTTSNWSRMELITGMTASPSGTGKVPLGRKHFWTSMMSNADLSQNMLCMERMAKMRYLIEFILYGISWYLGVQKLLVHWQLVGCYWCVWTEHCSKKSRRNNLSQYQLAKTKKSKLSRIRDFGFLWWLCLLIKATLYVLSGLWIINALLTNPPTSIPTCATQFETGCFPKLMLHQSMTRIPIICTKIPWVFPYLTKVIFAPKMHQLNFSINSIEMTASEWVVFCCSVSNFQVWWCFHTWVVKLYSRQQ